MTSLSGRIEDGVHHLPLRVYYEDTDAAGLVYYANYLKYAERARTEMIRLLGLSDIGAGAAFTVRRCTVDFLRPARLDDEIEVCTRVRAVRGASTDLEQVVRGRGGDLVRLDVRVAVITPSGRPTRLPRELRAALEPFVQSQKRA